MNTYQASVLFQKACWGEPFNGRVYPSAELGFGCNDSQISVAYNNKGLFHTHARGSDPCHSRSGPRLIKQPLLETWQRERKRAPPPPPPRKLLPGGSQVPSGRESAEKHTGPRPQPPLCAARVVAPETTLGGGRNPQPYMLTLHFLKPRVTSQCAGSSAK